MNLKTDWKKWQTRIRGWLFPTRCPVCDRPVSPAGEKICTECLPKLRPVRAPWCAKCGKMLTDRERDVCGDCSGSMRKHAFVRGRSLLQYESAAPSIYRFKYAGRREYAAFYAEETVRYLGDYLRNVQPDALVPIPLHKKRLHRRGYNQAEDYAREISLRTGYPMRADLLKRVKNTAPLKLLGPEQRQNNLKNAFIVPGNDVKLKRIMLVDDIYTTGASVDAAARVLMAAGAEEIYFVTIAGGKGV